MNRVEFTWASSEEEAKMLIAEGWGYDTPSGAPPPDWSRAKGCSMKRTHTDESRERG